MYDVFFDKINEFLGTVLTGTKARKKMGWEGNLTYGVNELNKLFNDGNLNIDNLDEFIVKCNEIINNDMRYKNIDEIIVKNIFDNDVIICISSN